MSCRYLYHRCDSATFSNTSGSLLSTGGLSSPAIFPRGHVGEVLVVAQRLAVGRLMLDAEVSAARLLAVERIAGTSARASSRKSATRPACSSD